MVRGFEIQGGVNWIKKKQLQHSRPGRWSSAVSWWSSHPGVQWLRYHLELLAVLLRNKGGTADGLLESGWVTPSVPGTKLLHALTTKLIS